VSFVIFPLCALWLFFTLSADKAGTKITNLPAGKAGALHKVHKENLLVQDELLYIINNTLIYNYKIANSV